MLTSSARLPPASFPSLRVGFVLCVGVAGGIGFVVLVVVAASPVAFLGFASSLAVLRLFQRIFSPTLPQASQWSILSRVFRRVGAAGRLWPPPLGAVEA